MPRIDDIGEVISERELLFISDNGEREHTYIRIGKPFKYSEELDWCCPYELVSDTHRRGFGMIGIDSLQALQLTVKTLSSEIEHWERTRCGKFHFLDEHGSGV